MVGASGSGASLVCVRVGLHETDDRWEHGRTDKGGGAVCSCVLASVMYVQLPYISLYVSMHAVSVYGMRGTEVTHGRSAYTLLLRFEA